MLVFCQLYFCPLQCEKEGSISAISQLEVALISKLRGSSMCLFYFLTSYPWVCVQPGTGRLVQELNVLNVLLYFIILNCIADHCRVREGKII